MKQASSVRQRLVVLGLLGAVLLNFPLLGLAAGAWAGVPAGFVYLFLVWLALIGVAGWIVRGQRR